MSRKMQVRWLAGAALAALAGAALANNLRVANVALQNQDAKARSVNVVFDLAWDDSWRDGENWDAAWVFVKFRAPGSNAWEHAALSTNSADHVPGAGSAVAAAADGRGVFIYGAGAHTGGVKYAACKLRWNYGANGCQFARGAPVEAAVHALEMVYIPQGAFHLGSGGNEPGRFYQHTDGKQTSQPFLVSSEAALAVTNTAGSLYYYPVTAATFGDGLGPVSNAFPKGFAAFYCMKYEISQGQYADFLNKLSPEQDRARSPNKSRDHRFTIEGAAPNHTVVRPERACNWLSWADLSAYTDWAALRPMTELEFEKTCRGPATPAPNEYAWGTTNIMPDKNRALSGAENGAETVTNSAELGGCNYGDDAHAGGDGGKGPLRGGIFATGKSSRAAAGASYYGVMELSGNVLERPVSVGAAAGRCFQGTHGDGALAADGSATNNVDWPGGGAAGVGGRGGAWLHAAGYLRVSDRSLAAWICNDRLNYTGGRAVRTAP